MNTASHNNDSRLLKLVGAFLLSFAVFFGIQGCSSSSNSPVVIAPSDSVPVGYFTGTALLDTGPTSVGDMVGMAYGNRLMMFSMSENVLFDITMDITLSAFTGTVDVYVSGQITGAGVTVTGTTSDFQIQGTFANGAGLSSGSFDILFDTNNNIGATLARTDGNVLFGDISGINVGTDGFADIKTSGTYDIGDTAIEVCEARGNFVIPDADVNIYQLSHDVVSIAGGTCSAPHLDVDYTGFASIIATTLDKDTFVFAYANGRVAQFSGALTR